MLDRVLLMGVLVLGGCVVDKQLGNTDGEDGDDGADGIASSDGTSTGGDPGGTLGMTGGPGDSGGSDPSASGDGGGSISMTATAGDDDGSLDSCIDWAPPPFDCDTDEGASMTVTVSPSFSAGEDVPCTVGATMPSGPDTDAFELDCDDGTHLVEVTTTPHVIPGLVTDQQVLLTYVPAQDPVFNAASFTIRSQSGGLILAHINEYDHDPDVDVTPLVFELPNSGCPGMPNQAICDEGDVVAVQRIPVEFVEEDVLVPLFSGNSATINGTLPYFTIVDSATRIQCVDESCGFSDAGPWDELRFLAMAVSPE